MKPVLYVGNRNYSSWSLRPWLVLKWSGLEFDTYDIDLDAEGYGLARVKAVLDISPTGRVPVLQVGSLFLWDSLAICEWVNENAPHANLWPADKEARAIARAISCEMHSGFSEIRTHLTCNIRRRVQEQIWNEATKIELQRLDDIFSTQITKYGGPYLFGVKPTIADAFYAPMATRLRTYNVSGLSQNAQQYSDFILSDAAFLEWSQSAEKLWKPFKAGPWDTIYE